MTAIYKRELKSLFSGMIAPVFMAFLLLMAGIYTCSVNFGAGYPEFERVISGISFIFLFMPPYNIICKSRFSISTAGGKIVFLVFIGSLNSFNGVFNSF